MPNVGLHWLCSKVSDLLKIGSHFIIFNMVNTGNSKPNVEQNPHPVRGVRNRNNRKQKQHYRSVREHGVVAAEKERNRARTQLRDAKKEGIDRTAILPGANPVRRRANQKQARKRAVKKDHGFDKITQAILRNDGRFLVNLPEQVLGSYFIRLWHVWLAKQPNPQNLESIGRASWTLPENVLEALQDGFSEGDSTWLLDVALNNVGRNVQIVTVRDQEDPQHVAKMYFKSPQTSNPSGILVTLGFSLPEAVQKHGLRLASDPRVQMKSATSYGLGALKVIPLRKMQKEGFKGAKITENQRRRSEKRALQSARDRRKSAAEKLA